MRGDFASLHDLVDRIERGYRLMRIDDVFLTEENGVITMRCTLRGIALAKSKSDKNVESEFDELDEDDAIDEDIGYVEESGDDA